MTPFFLEDGKSYVLNSFLACRWSSMPFETMSSCLVSLPNKSPGRRTDR